MTTEQFLKRHGAAWGELKRSPMFHDLIDTLRSFDPARSMPAVQAQSATEHAQHLLGRIAGFNLAVNAMDAGIAFEEITQEPPETYAPEDAL